jgi:hypothetical protein
LKLETKLKISNSIKKRWTDPEYKKKMKENHYNGNCFKKGYDIRTIHSHLPACNQKRRNSLKEYYKEHKRNLSNIKFEDLKSPGQRKKRILEEQNYKCNKCKLDTWLNQPMKFDLEHKNGYKQDNSRENLECLCPNCHSLTLTWCIPKKFLKNKALIQ